MTDLIDDIKHFVNQKILPNVEYLDRSDIYPVELVEIMKSMGLFGLTIPQSYGGLEIDIVIRIKIIEELSGGWVSLCSMLDSHLRACDYIVNFGTNEQKDKYLPLLAKGDLIAAHANNEKNMKIIENYETCLKDTDDSSDNWILSGRKEWITNSRNADIFAISARFVGKDVNVKTCVIFLEKNTNGLKVENNWNRMGVKGISLAPVTFKNCLVKKENIIGEFEYDGRAIIESSRVVLSMISSARSIGMAKKLIEKLSFYLLNRNRNGVIGSLAQEPVICLRLGQLISKYEAARALFNDCCLNLKNIDQFKLTSCSLFATETTKEIGISCVQLFGGAGYTSEYGIERYARDSLSSTIIHTSTDILSTQLGQLNLQNFKRKQANPNSFILNYTDYFSTNIKKEFLLKATLEEEERIINLGLYKNNISLFLYDMTTGNPNNSSKDVLACLTFAHCLQNNIHCFCAQSSDNITMSFIHYAIRNPSIKFILFYLPEHSYQININIVPNNIILIEVNSNELIMKDLVKRFTELTAILCMPTIDIQIDASQIRSHFIKDYSKKNQIDFSWYVQSLSNVIEPMGLYQGFANIQTDLQIPKFLGIEQQKNSSSTEFINNIKNILDTHGGIIRVSTDDTFQQYVDEAVSLLAKNRVYITKTKDGNLFDKDGILALTTVLYEINHNDNGLFSENDNGLFSENDNGLFSENDNGLFSENDNGLFSENDNGLFSENDNGLFSENDNGLFSENDNGLFSENDNGLFSENDNGLFSENDNVLIGITGGTACPAIKIPKPQLILDENATDEQLKLILEYV